MNAVRILQTAKEIMDREGRERGRKRERREENVCVVLEERKQTTNQPTNQVCR